MQQISTRTNGFQPGQSGNPMGKPKGTLSQRSQQWNNLHESIVGYHTDEFNAAMGKLWQSEPLVAMRMYLEVLNYFKPRLSSVNNNNLNQDVKGIVLHMDTKDIPEFPSNIEADDVDAEVL